MKNSVAQTLGDWSLGIGLGRESRACGGMGARYECVGMGCVRCGVEQSPTTPPDIFCVVASDYYSHAHTHIYTYTHTYTYVHTDSLPCFFSLSLLDMDI